MLILNLARAQLNQKEPNLMVRNGTNSVTSLESTEVLPKTSGSEAKGSVLSYLYFAKILNLNFKNEWMQEDLKQFQQLEGALEMASS